MTTRRHRGLTAVALSAFLALAAPFALQAATVTFVAQDEATGPAWLDTEVIKADDADGDNAYGTDGYSFPAWGATAWFQNPPEQGLLKQKTPDYITSITWVTDSPGDSWSYPEGNFQLVDPDNPSTTSQPGEWGYRNGVNWTEFLVIRRATANAFRLGVMSSGYTYNYRVTCGDGQDTQSSLSGRSGMPAYLFWDIGEGSDDVVVEVQYVEGDWTEQQWVNGIVFDGGGEVAPVAFVGQDDATKVAWLDDTVAKEFDVDADDAYGSDGYSFPAWGATAWFQNPPEEGLLKQLLPDYVSSLTWHTDSGGDSWSYPEGNFVLQDPENPTTSTQPGEWGYRNGTNWTKFITISRAADTPFRLGVVTSGYTYNYRLTVGDAQDVQNSLEGRTGMPTYIFWDIGRGADEITLEIQYVEGDWMEQQWITGLIFDSLGGGQPVEPTATPTVGPTATPTPTPTPTNTPVFNPDLLPARPVDGGMFGKYGWFSWEYQGATAYEIYLAQGSSVSDGDLVATLPDTARTYYPGELLDGATYSWFVRAKRDEGDVDSEVATFTTVGVDAYVPFTDGLLWWYEGDDVHGDGSMNPDVATDDPVPFWGDKTSEVNGLGTGAAHNAVELVGEVTASVGTLSRHTALNFDGTDGLMQEPEVLENALELHFWYVFRSEKNTGTILYDEGVGGMGRISTTSPFSFYCFDEDGTWEGAGDINVYGPGGTEVNKNYIVEMIIYPDEGAGCSGELVINGQSGGVIGPEPDFNMVFNGDGNPASIGCAWTYGYNFTGLISEMLWFDHALEFSNKEAVGLYLAKKYNITAYGNIEEMNPPDPAANPRPADGAIDVSIYTQLAWNEGADATSHDVYLAEGTGPLSAPEMVSQGQEATAYLPPEPLKPLTQYTWRVDEVNDNGVTPGDEWTFTTAAAEDSSLPYRDGLTCWLAADDIDGDGLPDAEMDDGAPVAAWNDLSSAVTGQGDRAPQNAEDQSPFGNFLQPLYRTTAANGLPAVDFLSTQTNMRFTAEFSNDIVELSAFFVARADRGALTLAEQEQGYLYYELGEGSFNAFFEAASGEMVLQLFDSDGNESRVSQAWPSSTWFIGEMHARHQTFPGAGLAVNGNLVWGEAWPGFTGLKLRGNGSGSLGYNHNLANSSMPGEIAEFVWFDHLVDDGVRVAVGEYLARKYGIAAYGHVPRPDLALSVQGGINGIVPVRFMYAPDDALTYTLAQDADFTQNVQTGDFETLVLYTLDGIDIGQEVTIYARVEPAEGDPLEASLTFTYEQAETGVRAWMLYE